MVQANGVAGIDNGQACAHLVDKISIRGDKALTVCGAIVPNKPPILPTVPECSHCLNPPDPKVKGRLHRPQALAQFPGTNSPSGQAAAKIAATLAPAFAATTTE